MRYHAEMKISIVGIGKVGTSVGFALTLNELCSELVLVSRSREKADAEAMDLAHAGALGTTPMTIQGGGFSDIAGSGLVVLCASAPIVASETWNRMQPAKDNWQLYHNLIPQLVEHAPDAIYLIVANPVDVLTYQTLQLSGIEPARVLGTGTIIDSARYRGVIARETGVHPMDIRAYVLGEHGESQFPAVSLASIGGERAESEQSQWDHFHEAVKSAYTVFRTRGYTNHAIAHAVVHITRSIVKDARHTLPVSVLMQDRFGVSDVCLSLPCVIGRQGIHRVLTPALSDSEADLFRKSAATVRAMIDTCQAG